MTYIRFRFWASQNDEGGNEMLTTTLLSIGLAMDAFAVSVCGGAVLKSVRVRQAIKVAIFFGVFQGVMPIIGYYIGLNFEQYISSVDHWVAFLLLAIIGGKMVYESLQSEKECKVDMFNNKNLINLSIATSIDALIVGMSFRVLDLSVVTTPIFIGAITAVLSFVGIYFGTKIGGVLSKKAEILGGLILIVIGIKVLYEHLS